MPASREKQQLVELGEVRFRTSFLVSEPFAFRAVNFPLHTTLVEIAEEGVNIGSEIQDLERERFTFRKIGMESVSSGEWAKFDILPVFDGARGVQPIHNFRKALAVGEWLAMI